MTKKIINDMVIGKRSIRQIPVSRQTKKHEREEDEIRADYRNRFKLPKVSGNRKPVNPKFVIWLIAVVCLLALFFGVSILFSSATVSIKPRITNLSFNNESFTAKLNSTSTTDLPFEVLKITKNASETVEATAEKSVSQKASGKIIIYNNYSTASQRLINNTRFESSNGKIYRLDGSVTIPGTKTVNGKIVPGSIEANIFADQPGDLYNMKVSDLTGDFKIPGFKGSPRYDKFYARLKTDITGGFVGKQKVIDDKVRQTAVDKLKLDLKEQLLKELYAIKPENYTIFANGYSLEYINESDTSALDENKVNINVTANLNSVVFNNLKLAKYLAVKKISDYDGLAIKFIPAEDLIATISAKDQINLWKNNILELKLNGTAKIQWIYDSESLKKDLAGKKKTFAQEILQPYQSSVSSISLSFRPVWTRYFPDDLKKIKIEEIN